MALPVTMYRWDDEGAPQVVDGKPSEYMNVLKKCLVEGYGTKTGLGWSVEDEIASPPLLTLRNDNNLGSGGYAVFSANNDNVREYIRAEGCQDYVDIDNRGRRSSYFEFYSYSSGANLNNRWFLIGTAKAFYFFISNGSSYNVNYGGTTPLVSFFMGDFNSLYPNDPASFISLSGLINSNNTNYTGTLAYKVGDSSAEKVTLIHPLDGSDSPHQASMISLGNRLYVAGRHPSEPSITVLSPIYLLMGDGHLNGSSSYQNQTIPYSRGILPGAVLANSPGYSSDSMPVIKTIDNTQYYLMPSAASHTGCVWINLEQW